MPRFARHVGDADPVVGDRSVDHRGEHPAVHVLERGRAGLVQQERTGRISRCSLVAGPVLAAGSLQLRLEATRDDMVYYEYSLDDGNTFTRFGNPVKLRFSWWKGARPALFSFTSGDAAGFVNAYKG